MNTSNWRHRDPVPALAMMLIGCLPLAAACGSDPLPTPSAQSSPPVDFGQVAKLEPDPAWHWPYYPGEIAFLENRRAVLLRSNYLGLSFPYEVSLVDEMGQQMWRREFASPCGSEFPRLAANDKGVTVVTTHGGVKCPPSTVQRLNLDGTDGCKVNMPNGSGYAFATMSGSDSWVINISIDSDSEYKKVRIYKVTSDCSIDGGTPAQDHGFSRAKPIGILKVADGWIALVYSISTAAIGEPVGSQQWAALGLDAAGDVKWRLSGTLPFTAHEIQVALTLRDGNSAFLTAYSDDQSKPELKRWLVRAKGSEELKPLAFARSLGKYGALGVFSGSDGDIAATVTLPGPTGVCARVVAWPPSGANPTLRLPVAGEAFLSHAGQVGNSWGYFWQWEGSSNGKAWIQWGPRPSSSAGIALTTFSADYGCP